jgi:hypothetical protein
MGAKMIKKIMNNKIVSWVFYLIALWLFTKLMGHLMAKSVFGIIEEKSGARLCLQLIALFAAIGFLRVIEMIYTAFCRGIDRHLSKTKG